jgi:hypothetical protein
MAALTPDRIRFETHEGVQLIILDASGAGAAELTAFMPHVKDVVSRQAPGSVRLLADITDTQFNAAAVAAFKDLIAANRPFMRASAVTGAQRIHQVVMNTVMKLAKRNFRSFDTAAEAKDWLAAQ